MTRVLSLQSDGGAITAGPSTGLRALSGLRGTGLPPVSLQWFEGAGDGATYRGGRVLPRVMDLDLKVYGRNRGEVADRLSLLGRIFAPTAGDVKMRVDLDGVPWFIMVRRTGGGDWSWDKDTDGKTFVRTVITVQAGDAYWEREDQEARSVKPGGLGRGLLKDTSLSKLELSTNAAFGSVVFQNVGDIPALAVWTVRAPFTGFELTSQAGESLVWSGDKQTGFVQVDMDLGTAVDETGANMYGGFGPVPRFWAIPPGQSSATILALNAAAPDTSIDVIWPVRKWVMF